MKKHNFIDIRMLLDEIFGAAEEFKNAFANEFKDFCGENCCWPERQDFYPDYSYPPVNVYLTEDRTMVIQYALAGFSESDINLEFKGDYLSFSAHVSSDFEPQENVRYFKRRLKLKDVKDQRFFVPADKYQQDKVHAAFVNSILTITIPPRETVQDTPGIKVNINSSATKNAEKKSKIKDA